MATLEEPGAAKKVPGGPSGEPAGESELVMGVSGSKLGEKRVRVSDLNEFDDDTDYPQVKNETAVEVSLGSESQFQSGLIVEENEENGAGNVDVVSRGDGSVTVRKEEGKEDGINLVVDVFGSLDGADKSEENGSFIENGGGSISTLLLNGSAPNTGEKIDKTEDERVKETANGNAGIVGGDHKEEVKGDGVQHREHDFRVGDFVWGKIKSHPWWPGQVYDPLDASDFAIKYKQDDCLLVSFFGDGSCAWCLPEQLVHFAINFEEMSKEGSSKSFLNAVQSALNEVGRVMESEMTCKCIAEETKVGLARPLVVNGGIKAGVLMPEVDTDRLLVSACEPAELLLKITNLAQTASTSSMLELAVLKSWLSAFYRSKGGYRLPVYCEPQEIEGLEGTSQIGGVVATDSSFPAQSSVLAPLEDDWLFAPSAGTVKSAALSEDKIYRRRKQKSVAEIMGETMDIKRQNKKRISAKGGTDSVKSTSAERKKRKGTDGKDGGSHGVSSTGNRRKTQVSRSEENVSKAESVGVGGMKDTNGGTLSTTLTVDEVSAVENIGGEANQELEKESTARERKKSKYLSPPYTNLLRRIGNSSCNREWEIESKKIAKVARVGERVTKAVGDLFPPSLSKHVSAKRQRNGQKKGLYSSHDLSSLNGNVDLVKTIENVDVDYLKEVLSKLQSCALDPFYLSKEDLFFEFMCAYRKLLFGNDSNYTEFIKHRLRSDLTQTKAKAFEPRTGKAGARKIEAAKSDTTKPKKTALVSGTKIKVEEVKLDIGYIKQKLQTMTTVLQSCSCKSPVEISGVKDEMSHLLEKFGTAVEKVSSIVETNSS